LNPIQLPGQRRRFSHHPRQQRTDRPHPGDEEADTAGMRSVGLTATCPPVLAASAGLLLVTMIGCSFNRGSSDVTTVVFDGDQYTIEEPVSCGVQPDGKLLINAPSDPRSEGGKKLIRVLLTEDYRLVVEAAGFRFLGVRGFTDDSSEMWATKVDTTYTVTGRMPPDDGGTAWHQFKIEVTCQRTEKVFTTRSPSALARVTVSRR
jgi:hypothetical protein